MTSNYVNHMIKYLKLNYRNKYLFNFFSKRNTILLEHLPNDKIHVCASNNKSTNNSKEESRSKISLSVEIIGTKESKHEAAGNAHQELDNQNQKAVDLLKFINVEFKTQN